MVCRRTGMVHMNVSPGCSDEATVDESEDDGDMKVGELMKSSRH